MSTIEDAKGPVIVWLNHGCEGWHPKSYPTLKEALLGERYASEFVITRILEFDVAEKGS